MHTENKTELFTSGNIMQAWPTLPAGSCACCACRKTPPLKQAGIVLNRGCGPQETALPSSLLDQLLSSSSHSAHTRWGCGPLLN